jgi:predicted RNA binding protein YcfA (HicA-like mRNA interferase family)
MSKHLPALRPREVLRALIRTGFFIHHSTGGHHVLKHPAKPALRVTLPWHSKDLKRRTLVSIIGQSGLTIEEFLGLL